MSWTLSFFFSIRKCEQTPFVMTDILHEIFSVLTSLKECVYLYKQETIAVKCPQKEMNEFQDHLMASRQKPNCH